MLGATVATLCWGSLRWLYCAGGATVAILCCGGYGGYIVLGELRWLHCAGGAYGGYIVQMRAMVLRCVNVTSRVEMHHCYADFADINFVDASVMC